MWNTRFSGEDYFYGTEPNDYLKAQADALVPGEALCLGAGEGRNAVYLAGLGFDVTAMDISAVGLTKALKLAQSRGFHLTTHEANIVTEPFGEARWDLITSIFCHLPSAVRPELYRKVVRALRPGGHFILEAYTPEQLQLKTGGPREIDLLLEPEATEAQLEGLEFLHVESKRRTIKEGLGHQGESAVLQIFGQKPAS